MTYESIYNFILIELAIAKSQYVGKLFQLFLSFSNGLTHKRHVECIFAFRYGKPIF